MPDSRASYAIFCDRTVSPASKVSEGWNPDDPVLPQDFREWRLEKCYEL